MAVHLRRHSAGLLETIKCVYLSLRKLHAVWLSDRSVPAFTAPKSTGHESFLSTWQRPRTWLKTTKYRARGITMTSRDMQGHCPFPSSPSPPLFSSHLSLGSNISWAAGWERWAGVTGTLNPIQRGRPQGKEEQKIYTKSTSLLYVEIYGLAERKA